MAEAVGGVGHLATFVALKLSAEKFAKKRMPRRPHGAAASLAGLGRPLRQPGPQGVELLVGGDDVAVDYLVALPNVGELAEILVPQDPHLLVLGPVQAAAGKGHGGQGQKSGQQQ